MSYRARTFFWRGRLRVANATDARRGRPVRSLVRTQTVQVSGDVYAALTVRALEYGVTNKALLEYVLRDLPRSGRMERQRAMEGRAR